MIETLLFPLELAFIQRALMIGTLIAVPMALLSSFLVLRGWSLMGDAISHAVLPGIVGAYMLGLPLIIGAFLAGMGCAMITGYLEENSRVKEDTVMGVVFSGMFGLGLVMYAMVETEVHLDHILFGNMLGLTDGDIWTAGLIGLAITAAILLKRRDFVVHVFDPTHGHVIGLPMRAMHYGLLTMISLAVVAALSAVGLILAIALLISPAAIALLWSRRFGTILVTAVAVTVGSTWAGIYLSVFIDSAPAPTIVLVLTAIFIASFTLNARTRI